MEKLHIVSTNLKTDWSINFPIADNPTLGPGTCSPTPVCEKLCYAKRGRLAMSKSISRQHRVLQVFEQEDPELIAKVIAEGYRKRNLSFIRWCGVGDLVPESCRVINILGTQYQDTCHWIVTRKVDMVELLERDMPNVFIQFSLDGSQDSRERQNQVRKINHPRVYFSYLRFYEEEDTLGASIIFNYHGPGQKNLSYNPRCCPVDSGRLPTLGACQKCRKCFNPKKVYKNEIYNI